MAGAAKLTNGGRTRSIASGSCRRLAFTLVPPFSTPVVRHFRSSSFPLFGILVLRRSPLLSPRASVSTVHDELPRAVRLAFPHGEVLAETLHSGPSGAAGGNCVFADRVAEVARTRHGR